MLRKKYGPAVDCWSVGVLVYVLLCGGPPFWGETDEDLFQSILNVRAESQLSRFSGIAEFPPPE